MNNKEIVVTNKRRNKMSQTLITQYFLSVFLYALALAVFAIVCRNICESRIWYRDEFLYGILHIIKEYFWFFAGIAFLAGWIPITYYFMSKPIKYLNEVAEASKQLTTPTSEPIVLSDSLFYIENELNNAREKALNNARAAKDAEQRKNDLVVYLAHDLKTPLTSVIGYLTLLHDEGQISEELREKYLSISLEKAERLEDLINEFFEITRFNLSEITLEYSTVNLTRLLEQLTYEFKPMFMQKNLTCKLDIAPDTMIKCDVNKIQRVFDNLLRNAVNYSFVNGNIYINAHQENNNLHIKFKNDGNTIPREKLDRIFEQFYRLDTSRSSNSGGAGLGLAIAKEIVEHHSGTITAKSENDTVEFEVTLPIS